MISPSHRSTRTPLIHRRNRPCVTTASRRFSWLLIAFLALTISSETASAATVHYVQNSVNDATGSTISAVDSDQYRDTAVAYTTVTAPMTSGANRFTHWTNSSYPFEAYRDSWGRSLNPIVFTLYEDTTATAHYLPTTRNTDGDGVPDWYEIEYYGTLTNAGTFDSDGDGLTLLQENTGGTHPLYANATREGGISYADSTLITYNAAGYATYTLRSVPAGTVNESAVVPPGTVITSPDFTQATFGYWTLDGVRQTDAWGVAQRQISFTMASTDREGVAVFFTSDVDTDGVPDAWENYYYGTTANAANSDTDADGRLLIAEYQAGTSPIFGNAAQEGGIAYADSAMVTVNLADFSRYTLRSEPAGTVNQSAIVPDGTVVTSSNLTQTTFGYWTVDGVRQQDPWGVGLRQISFTMNGADREAVAYFPTGDTDTDGIADAWEMYYFGTLTRGAADDSDGDGIPLNLEVAQNTSPVFGNAVREGGVSWADSTQLIVNAQIFERWKHAQVDAVLSPIFSFDPDAPTGWDFGSKSAPTLGDWDGDGDLDLMVFHSAGVVVYENLGTRATMNYTERSSAFGALASALAGNTGPVAAMGDWTNDGLSDLVLGGATATLQFFVSTGSFSAPMITAGFTVTTGSSHNVPAFADLNGDGKTDLLVLLADGTVQLYFNTGNLAAPYSTYIADILGVVVPNGTGLGVIDTNGDGRLDVLVSDRDGRIWDFRGQSGGGFILQSKVWAGSGDGFAGGLTIAVADIDGDGDADYLAGADSGALLYLRDPHLGRPSDLRASSGASSILLSWAPDAQSRLRGYNVYRADGTPDTWASLLAQPVRLPTYRDEALVSGDIYFYRVTAVSYAYLPGNSVPKIMETAPSDIASAESGRVSLSLRRTRGKPANYVKMPISIENSLGLRGTGMQIVISYDPSVMIPAAQADAARESVEKTGLSAGLVITDNGATANGTLTINGVSGDFEAGEGKLFTLEFKVKNSAVLGTTTAVGISAAVFYSTTGLQQTVDISGSEFVEIEDDFTLGDVTGDGVLTDADEVLLKELTKPKARDATPEELRAGDLNGDGKLTQLDVVLLKRLLQGLPVN